MIRCPDPFPALDWSAANVFSVNALDRRSGERTDPGFIARAFEDPRARLMLLHGDRLLVTGGEDARPYLTGAALDKAAEAAEVTLFLGLDAEGAPWFAVEAPREPETGPDAALVDLRTLALEGRIDDGLYGPAAQARALLFWHKRNRFCGACGGPTVAVAGGYQRSCPACGTEHFPRTDPVVIMLITDGERALLGRQARFNAGMYTCLAGFLEPGETVEDAVRREVAEESGIAVGAIRYHSSQPWPFPANLMLGCLGEALTTDITIDFHELEDCRWFPRSEVLAMLEGRHPDGLTTPFRIAIARSLIEAWAKG
jgi:NAD+ diphosphatase